MIRKLTVSVFQKNIPVLKCLGQVQNLKLMHYFSDNNKKSNILINQDPFQKFKRNTQTPKNDIKAQNQKPSENKEQQKEQKKPEQNNIQGNQKQNQNSAGDHLNRPVTGFGKFKRSTNFEGKLDKGQQQTEQKKQAQGQATKQESESRYNQQKDPQESSPKESATKQSQQPKPTPKSPIKGFSKFQRTQAQSTDNNQQEHKVNPPNPNQQPPEPTLNTKSSEQLQRQNAYKKTQNKIQQDKQQWQGFLQDQIKKEKQKKQKKAPYEWKNFDFTARGKQQQKGKDKTGHEQKGRAFTGPKTPLEAMKMLFFGGIGIYLGSLLLSEIFAYDNSTIIPTDQMLTLLKSGRILQSWFLTSVQSLSQNSSRTKKYACATLDSGQIYKCESNNDFQMQWSRLIDQYNMDTQMFGGVPVIKKVPIIKKDNHVFNSVRSILSIALLFMFLKSIMGGISRGKGQMGGKGGGLSGLFQNTKSNRFRQNINVKFDDVVGMNKAKEQIVQFIDFLKNAQKYNKLGARIPRGALLTGPPGTGKTMLAKACAGQSGVPFFTISGSQFMQMYVGVGAQRVRNLFAQAKQTSPSIIFIDQIDAVGKKRSSGAGGGGNDQRDNTLNQLLVEMDGFDQSTNVIVFAATNQKQVLDPALTRPGRFDRLIQVDLPDIQGRKEIFQVHLKPITLDQKYSVQDYSKRLATLTPGFSGAEIKNLCNQAAIIAARNDKKSVSMIDFQLASERIIGGVEKKSTLITPETKRTVAYHQCGHGVVAWFMEHASPLLKLTIIPRSKGALGYAQYLPNETNVYTRKQLEDQICVILGGRISQQIFFDKISTGASDDLQKAHKVAKAIVAEYGMGKTLGWLSYGQTQYVKQYSHLTEQKIDQQILQIIYECSIKTRQIINSKKDMIRDLAELLLKEETIDQRMIQGILGDRPFKSSKQYDDYIREKRHMEEQQEHKKVEEITAVEGSASFKSLGSIESLDLIKGLNPASKSQKINIIESC